MKGDSIYRSKIDIWLAILFSLSIIGACVWLISLDGTYTFKGFAFGVTLLTVNIILPIWFLLRRHYIISSHSLLIHFGPLSWSIPFDSISQVHNSSRLSFSPALSLDRLEIVYGSDHSILISPVEQAKFVEELSDKLSLHRSPPPHLRSVS